MPIYDYACGGCAHEFEREQRISEKPVRKCPACGARKARRLISRTSFVLKGGGWYNDLYASQKPAAKKEDAKAAGKGDAGEKKSSADGKSESGGAKGKSDKSGKNKSGTKAA